jgi:hypothetical protein
VIERATRSYADDYDHIRDELRRLDLRIRLRTKTLPLLNQIAPASQIDRTAYISPEEVTWLLSEAGQGALADDDVAATRLELADLSARIDAAVAGSRNNGTILALPRIAALFELSEFETQA